MRPTCSPEQPSSRANTRTGRRRPTAPTACACSGATALRGSWDAGPLGDEKGFGICHGTAGNGYALLRTFDCTGDERWLERARAFAVHALEQVERMPGRYTLFTGGLGTALFAGDCIDAQARFPVLEDL